MTSPILSPEGSKASKPPEGSKDPKLQRASSEGNLKNKTLPARVSPTQFTKAQNRKAISASPGSVPGSTQKKLEVEIGGKKYRIIVYVNDVKVDTATLDAAKLEGIQDRVNTLIIGIKKQHEKTLDDKTFTKIDDDGLHDNGNTQYAFNKENKAYWDAIKCFLNEPSGSSSSPRSDSSQKNGISNGFSLKFKEIFDSSQKSAGVSDKEDDNTIVPLSDLKPKATKLEEKEKPGLKSKITEVEEKDSEDEEDPIIEEAKKLRRGKGPKPKSVQESVNALHQKTK